MIPFETIIQDLLADLGQQVVNEAQQTTLFHHSSSFEQQIITYPQSSDTQIIESSAPWSSYLEEGNPYAGFIIRPQKASALHFVINGQDVFSKKSTAHGPLPFMQNAVETVCTDDNVDQVLQEVLNRYSKG
jgi:hypothetical protein